MESFDSFLRPLTEALTFPLFDLAGNVFTLQSLAKFMILLGLVFLGETMIRRFVILRVLRRTHLSESMQFAVGRILGYVIICLGFYITLKLVGIDLS